jgi:hypothetical protein
MRFKAPAHVSDAHLATGIYPVVDGIIEVPDDSPQADLAGLAANGFTLPDPEAPAEPEAQASAKAGRAPAPAPAETPVKED